MTQRELAELIGVTRQTVIAIEGDKYSPSLEVAFRIAEVFDVPLEEVFSVHTRRWFIPERKAATSATRNRDRRHIAVHRPARAHPAAGKG